LIAQWHAALAENGFLMFSALGPDTLRELRALYASLGWPAPSQAFTDMHDWGDMLLAQGFAEPVMDMETITLTFATPQRALQELRELGRNLHPERFATLRGKAWKQALISAMQTQLSTGPEGSISLSFEIIYGHAIKPQLLQQAQLAQAKADPALGAAHIPLAQVKKALSEQRNRPNAKN
jgi:malonyl-CoA O-methyltransferase